MFAVVDHLPQVVIAVPAHVEPHKAVGVRGVGKAFAKFPGFEKGVLHDGAYGKWIVYNEQAVFEQRAVLLTVEAFQSFFRAMAKQEKVFMQRRRGAGGRGIGLYGFSSHGGNIFGVG